jgi:hypothetical protein
MEFFLALALSAPIFQTYDLREIARNDAYCQNIYWQANAIEKMTTAWCDLKGVEEEIQFVKSGKFE